MALLSQCAKAQNTTITYVLRQLDGSFKTIHPLCAL